MTISLSEAAIMVSSGMLIFSILSLVHFVSTYNRHHRSHLFMPAILAGAVSIYHINTYTGYGLMGSIEYSALNSIVGLISLFPIILAIVTLVLFRISLLTNWSVDATS